jgi:hypothetical protein
MSESTQVLAGYCPITGICPESWERRTFLLSLEFARQVQRHHPYWKFMAIGSLAEVLTTPTSLYKGLAREGFEDGYCYFGVPSVYYRSRGIETDFPTGFVLGVSVNWDQRGFIILDWEKRRVDDSGKPLGADKDFGGPKCIPNLSKF